MLALQALFSHALQALADAPVLSKRSVQLSAQLRNKQLRTKSCMTKQRRFVTLCKQGRARAGTDRSATVCATPALCTVLCSSFSRLPSAASSACSRPRRISTVPKELIAASVDERGSDRGVSCLQLLRCEARGARVGPLGLLRRGALGLHGVKQRLLRLQRENASSLTTVRDSKVLCTKAGAAKTCNVDVSWFSIPARSPRESAASPAAGPPGAAPPAPPVPPADPPPCPRPVVRPRAPGDAPFSLPSMAASWSCSRFTLASSAARRASTS